MTPFTTYAFYAFEIYFPYARGSTVRVDTRHVRITWKQASQADTMPPDMHARELVIRYALAEGGSLDSSSFSLSFYVSK
jgi:hypothetical protein